MLYTIKANGQYVCDGDEAAVEYLKTKYGSRCAITAISREEQGPNAPLVLSVTGGFLERAEKEYGDMITFNEA